ncbi:hypothetical protein BKA81DRAFT_363147 [Phyllosticta paracitricarpa]
MGEGGEEEEDDDDEVRSIIMSTPSEKVATPSTTRGTATPGQAAAPVNPLTSHYDVLEFHDAYLSPCVDPKAVRLVYKNPSSYATNDDNVNQLTEEERGGLRERQRAWFMETRRRLDMAPQMPGPWHAVRHQRTSGEWLREWVERGRKQAHLRLIQQRTNEAEWRERMRLQTEKQRREMAWLQQERERRGQQQQLLLQPQTPQAMLLHRHRRHHSDQPWTTPSAQREGRKMQLDAGEKQTPKTPHRGHHRTRSDQQWATPQTPQQLQQSSNQSTPFRTPRVTHHHRQRSDQQWETPRQTLTGITDDELATPTRRLLNRGGGGGGQHEEMEMEIDAEVETASQSMPLQQTPLLTQHHHRRQRSDQQWETPQTPQQVQQQLHQQSANQSTPFSTPRVTNHRRQRSDQQWETPRQTLPDNENPTPTPRLNGIQEQGEQMEMDASVRTATMEVQEQRQRQPNSNSNANHSTPLQQPPRSTQQQRPVLVYERTTTTLAWRERGQVAAALPNTMHVIPIPFLCLGNPTNFAIAPLFAPSPHISTLLIYIRLTPRHTHTYSNTRGPYRCCEHCTAAGWREARRVADMLRESGVLLVADVEWAAACRMGVRELWCLDPSVDEGE